MTTTDPLGTVVLVLTCLEDITADLVIKALHDRGTTVVRLDPTDLGQGVSFDSVIGEGAPSWSGTLRTPTRTIELDDIDAVYYRRPSPWRSEHPEVQTAAFVTTEARHGFGGLLHNLPHAIYVNHPSAVARADRKPGQLQTAAQIGLKVPPTLVTNDPNAARAFAEKYGNVVYKPFRGLPQAEDGTAGAIWAQRVEASTFDESLSVTAHLFQAEVDKIADARVTVVGNQFFASRITTTDGVLDWRRADWDELSHAPVAVPASIASALRRYLEAYGLAFGCFDLALTGPDEDPRSWVWLECNPNGQWGWLPDSAGIAEAFADSLTTQRTRP
ncbi:ATP-grasp ribosomal peptide maturase [Nocardiopsis valliformis]|uniref:ATP-grasp ribosomal peptide maturase n=1 Tax=Nocardiopsis valliformis TaxID=239974 RepID=UPI000A3050F4|nr:ATP-grasp ribosomal peptide maturase [Nocardiopsis valliformis]